MFAGVLRLARTAPRTLVVLIICCGTVAGQTPPNSAPPESSRAGTTLAPILVAPVASAPAEKKGAGQQIVAALAWPLVALIIVLSFHRRIADLLRELPRFISSIKAPGGFEIEFTPEKARQVSSFFQNSFKDLIDQAKTAYDHAVEVNRIYERLGDVLTDSLAEILADLGVAIDPLPPYRGTVHVPDVVFKEYLYQLTDYFPAGGGGAGRRFSERYGIIGRAWRLKLSLGMGNAIEQDQTEQQVRQALIGEWGMLPSEAIPGAHGKPAYLCIMLRSADQEQGLIFIDSPTENAFGDNDVAQQAAELLMLDQRTIRLADAVLQAMKPLRQAGTFIAISQ